MTFPPLFRLPLWRSQEDRWKLIEFENWARFGDPASINYVLRYTAPEVRTRAQLLCSAQPDARILSWAPA